MKLGIPEYTVNEKVTSSYICPECEGTGRKEEKVRKRIYVSKCKKCQGEGRVFNHINTEVPFIKALEAMEEMGLIVIVKK